ncbi:FG-GAP-like repeat-containing protein [Streptomyces gardneri]|uniref:FG-GAP-like repeat-containing protein n=1 Tax=Streptomyces gardneri TaxID=66892 RepID=UPI0036C9EC5E
MDQRRHRRTGHREQYYIGGGRPTSYSARQLRPSGLKAGDVLGDGKPDVVTVNAGTSDISVLLGDGRGTFRNASPLYVEKAGANGSYAIGDLNADGRPDVAAASTAAGVAAQVLLNTSKPKGTAQSMSCRSPRRPVSCLAPGAQAAPAPVPSPTPPESAAGAPFGVQAGLYGLTTLTGGHFGYALKAGARIEDSAVIHNESDEARTFHVYAADVANAAGGGLAPAQEGQKMAAVGAWLKPEFESTVTVQPKSSTTVRFSLAVPAGTPAGSYLGSLVTALCTPAVSGGLNTETRIARLVELTVPGSADLQVTLTELEHRPAGGGEEFTVTVRNTGNVLYTFAGTLNITDGSTARTVPLTPQDLRDPRGQRHPRRRRPPCPGPAPRHHAQATACLAAASRRGTYRATRTAAGTAGREPACRRH